jgi:hypothetical protein
MKFRFTAIILLFFSIVISLFLLKLSIAQSTPTSCGVSQDGGIWAYVQIYFQGQYPDPVDGGALLHSYKGQGAYAELDGVYTTNGQVYYYPISVYYFTSSGQSWDSGPRLYSMSYARIYAYDGNPSSAQGTFVGYILNGVPYPSCSIQAPTG